MKQPNFTSNSRRDFLKKVAIIGGVTGAAAVVANVLTPVPVVRKREADPRENTASGYRLTEHIRTYYDKARI